MLDRETLVQWRQDYDFLKISEEHLNNRLMKDLGEGFKCLDHPRWLYNMLPQLYQKDYFIGVTPKKQLRRIIHKDNWSRFYVRYNNTRCYLKAVFDEEGYLINLQI